MATDFLRSNPALDKAVAESTNFEEMREKMLATLAAQGTVTRDREDAYNVRVIGQPQQVPSLPAADAVNQDRNRVSRVIYPSGNNRFEIFAADEAGLDEIERQVKGIFSAR